MYELAERLFPICRSITGDGTRLTHRILGEQLPGLVTHEVPSGTVAFDWVVPDEWNIRAARIIDPNGDKVVDFDDHNLHVMGYSTPVAAKMSLDELQPHLYSLPDQPDAIPYVTSYYERRWGFCLSHAQRLGLSAGTYDVAIESTLAPGSLTYSDLVLPGSSTDEILITTYTCHPSLANNELSGPVVAVALAQWLAARSERRFTYRFVFGPETIGAIVYLSRHLEHLRKHTVAGWVVTCVGDDRCYSYVPSRNGGTLADRISRHVLSHHAPGFREYTFLDRGSDERQYCSPGVDLPVCSVMRSKYGAYPEYHTSLDDLSVISPNGLEGAFRMLARCIEAAEANYYYRAKLPCEPQLGKRGLYPTISAKGGHSQSARDYQNVAAYADGTKDLLELAEVVGLDASDCAAICQRLYEGGVLQQSSEPV